MRSRVQLIETTTEKVSRILSENYGIRVVFKKDMCCTNGKTIFLPVIGQKADEEFLSVIPGMVDHESGHIRHSDFGVIKSFKKEKNPGKLHDMTNVCEDARIENKVVQEWRGSRVNLTKLSDWACKRLLKDWSKLSQWGRLFTACAAVASGGSPWFVEETKKLEPELWKYIDQILPLLLKAKDQKDTKGSVALAKEILEKLHDLADPPPPPEKEKGKGKKSNKKTRGDGQGNCSGSSIDEDEDEDEEEGEDGEEGDGEEDEDEDAPDCLNRDFDPSEEEQAADEEIASKENMIQSEARKAQESSRGSYMIYSTEKDVIVPISNGDATKTRRLLAESRHITNVMRVKMMRNLLSKNRSRRDPGKERGKIDRRSLFRVPIGTSNRVFWQKVDAPEFNTRASLWIDHSGSMTGKKIRLAAASAILFGEVLNSLKIPFEVCGFSTSTRCYEGQYIYDHASPEDRSTFTRWGGLWVGVYKSFEESWDIVKHRCSRMENNEHDNTYDGECLRLAAQRLLQYPEPRRILFWFNDGEPYPNVSDVREDHERYLKKVAAEVEKMIEVFAVGINSHGVEHYYTNSVVINSMEDLPKVMVGELDRLLRKNQNAYLGASL